MSLNDRPYLFMTDHGGSVLKPEAFQPYLRDEPEYAEARPVGGNNARLYILGPAIGNIAHTAAYKSGSILPLDPNSVLAVDALKLQVGEHVLDLCCAPGTKLVLMAMHVGSVGSVTGVDISRERLGAAVNLAKKYRLPRARLFCADGRTFCQPVHHVGGSRREGDQTCQDDPFLIPSSPLAPSPSEGAIVSYERGAMPVWSSSPYRKQRGILCGLYDKVLVDAQCTHDGSIKHVRKHISNEWRYFEEEHFGEAGLKELYELQYALLCNGFRQLRKGGLVVYSTCSQSKHQNEAIIERFMHEHQDQARIVTESLDANSTTTNIGSWGQALRLSPEMDRNGGGFFVCTIRRET